MAKRKTPEDNHTMWLEYGIDIAGRQLVLDSDIEEDTASILLKGLYLMEKDSLDKPITVNISTTGGACYDGLGIYDALRASPCQIITVGIGKVMSMGTILMLAGDVRRAYPNTTFMWHTITAGGDGKLFEIETNANESKRIYSKMLDIYGERSSEPRSFWIKWLKQEDRYRDTLAAVELGFVHEIIVSL